MGRPPKAIKSDTPVSTKPPVLKFAQAVRIADKNARTIMKISQLMEVVHLPGYAQADPQGKVGSHIAALRSRLDRRLNKLTRWADCSADERHLEFKAFSVSNTGYPYRTLIKPMPYSKPTSSFINPNHSGLQMPIRSNTGTIQHVISSASSLSSYRPQSVQSAPAVPHQLQQLPHVPINTKVTTSVYQAFSKVLAKESEVANNNVEAV